MSNNIRYLPVPDRWCVHSYYTLCPYAPDGSERLLLAGADLETGTGEVLILSPGGQVIDRFGKNTLNNAFYHTGWWQSWSPDAKWVYYQGGTLNRPTIIRRELATGREQTQSGCVQGAPPSGEPLISALMGMQYAAGHGDGKYQPQMAPVPFQQRSRHGLFEYRFDPAQETLLLRVSDVLEHHPQRDLLLKADREVKERLGAADGLSLMTYCVRWSPDGSRFLFFFGNHTVVKSRGEPRLSYVFTTNREMTEMHLAVDISYQRRGVHWSWHPDGEHLIGYGPDQDDETRQCLAQVRYDGSDYRRLSNHASGGHPSISPTDYNLIVTDEYTQPGNVVFIAANTGETIETRQISRRITPQETIGRNPQHIDHHPVFHPSGQKVLVNTLADRHAVLAEIPVPGATL